MKNLEGFSVRMKCGPFLTLGTWFFLIRLHQRQIALTKKFRNTCFLQQLILVLVATLVEIA